ncbi:uncharacterized protein [Miscanthus floridulus]|uniref:uncharacterized protein n=1 Tax=Miscanthus floridulus TaxID=154761 RepID=UPI003459EA4E
MRNYIPNITEAEVITAFVRGLHHHELRSKFNRKPPSGIGEMIMTANQYADAEEAEIHFPASNNAMEYEACLHGLRIAIELGVKRLMVYEDSTLVIIQLNKDWSYSSEKMDAYCAEIRKLEGKFYGIMYHHVVRDQNQPADQLSKIGSSRAMVPPGVFVQDLLVPSIKEEKEVEEVPPTEQLVLAVPSPIANWREQFIKYLTSTEVPTDKTETERLIRRSKHYVLVDDNLMRKSAKEGILQKCIT